jgi:hypothetical protein
MSTDKVSKKETGNSNAWMKKFNKDATDAGKRMRKEGIYFQGENGEVVRGVFFEHHPRQEETKNGNPVWQIKVIRLDNAKEQTFSWPPFVAKVMTDIITIAQSHNGDMLDVVFEVKFQIKNGNSVAVAVNEVVAPEITQTPEIETQKVD